MMDKITLGQSAAKRDITAFIKHSASNQYIYFIAGVHGDEIAGIYVLEQLFTWLQQQNFTFPYIVIPVVNPDGYAVKTRVNANQVDLNRNWPTEWSADYTEVRYFPGSAPLSEPENILLNDLFKQYPPEFILSFHAMHEPMLDHNKYAKQYAEFLSKYINYKVVNHIGYPTPGSLGKYTDEVLKCGLITYEVPEVTDPASMQQIWQQNAQGLQKFCKFLQNNC